LQVGLGEAWGAPLRVSMAQQLARYWIGGVTRIATAPGREAEGWWFGEGVSRYVALVVLGRLGLLTHDDQRSAVVGMLSVLATSPHRALDNVALAQLSRDPVARATAMARGTLYALRESAAIRKNTKDARSMVDVLRTIERGGEDRKDHAATTLQDWLDTVGKDDPDAAKRFDALVTKGGAPDLPTDALGPCFRAGTGEHVAFDPGFDFEATKIAADGKVVGLRDGGPAAKAGLQAGDAIESMEANEDSADVPVKLVVTRAGAKVTLHYVPRGAHGRGQTFTRVAGVPDSKCGDVH
jgi:predicted metalloprotease with PDZ domain